MDKGHIKQFGTPNEIIREPADEFVTALIRSAEKQYVVQDGGGI
jgi:ABC-type proline/glycine betaine transport system ATPase subunit